MKKPIHLAIAALALASFCATPAFAQRGGGRGGGGSRGGGGGGGMRGGGGGMGGGRPSFNRTPSFTPPRGGGGFQGGMRPSAPAARPAPGPGAGGPRVRWQGSTSTCTPVWAVNLCPDAGERNKTGASGRGRSAVVGTELLEAVLRSAALVAVASGARDQSQRRARMREALAAPR